MFDIDIDVNYKLPSQAFGKFAARLKDFYKRVTGTDSEDGDGAGHVFGSDDSFISFQTVGSVCTNIDGTYVFSFLTGEVAYDTDGGFYDQFNLADLGLADDNSDTIKTYYNNAKNYDPAQIVASTNYHVRNSAVPSIGQEYFTKSNIYDPTGQGLYSCLTGWQANRTGTYTSIGNLRNGETPVFPCPASQINNYTGSGYFSRVQQYLLTSPIVFNMPIPNDATNIQNTYYNNNEYNYVFNKDILYFTSSGDTSYDDIQYVFNNDIIPYIQTDFPNIIAPDITFPDFKAPSPPPEGYIAPLHDINYSLQMPGTGDYLDVSVITSPLSICAQSLDYFWNAVTSLGFAPVLGFCLVATLVIKGLRGD